MPSGTTDPMATTAPDPIMSSILEAIEALRVEVSIIRPLKSQVDEIQARMIAPVSGPERDLGPS